MNIRTATLRTSKRRVYSPASVRRRPVKTRSRVGVRLSRLEMVGIFAAVVLFCTGLWTSYEVNRISTDITQLNREKVMLTEAGDRLEQQKERMLGKGYLTPLGRKFGLHPPASGQVVTLN